MDGLPSVEGLVADPLRTPVVGPEMPEEIGLAHILVTYMGAYRPSVRAEFDHRQALVRAQRLVQLARAKGKSFSELASRFSDDATTSADGGRLGVFSRGELHPDVEQAAFSMGLGQVSDPIHTPKGYRILTRIEPYMAQASEIVVSYSGASRYTPRVERSREEAAALVKEIHARLAAGSHFADEAFAHSDQGTWKLGGFLPLFEKGTRNEQFEQIVWNLAPGQLSDAHETTTGFHIVGRWPVRRIRLRQVNFAFLAEGGDPTLTDAPPESAARAQAEAFIQRARQPGADFVSLAAEAQGTDEDVGLRTDWLIPEDLPHPIGKHAFGLEVGEVSGAIRTEQGFFVIKRVP